jgi:hypothetical protein
MVGQKSFPVTTARVPATVRLSQAEALELANGDKDLTRRVDDRTVLVLNFPGQEFDAQPEEEPPPAKAVKRRTRAKS